MTTAADFWRALARQPAEGVAAFEKLPQEVQAKIADPAIDAFLEKARDAAWKDEEHNVAQCLKHAERVTQLHRNADRWRRLFEVQVSLHRYESALRTAQRESASTAKLLTSLASSLSKRKERTQVDVTTFPLDFPAPPPLLAVLDAIVALPSGELVEHAETCLFALGAAGRVEDGLRLLETCPANDDLSWHLSWGLLYGGDAASIEQVAERATKHAATCRVHQVVVLAREGRLEDAERVCSVADDRGRLAMVRYHARTANLDVMSEVADAMVDRHWRILAELDIVELALAMGQREVAATRLALARELAGRVGHRAHAERLARAMERVDGDAKLTVDEAVALAIVRLRTEGIAGALQRVNNERAGKRRVNIGYRVLRAVVDHAGIGGVAKLELEGVLGVLALAAMADAEDEVRDYERARELIADARRATEDVRSKSERAALAAKLDELESRL